MICGIFLPAKTNVFMSAPVVHADKNVFGEDAEEFRPERWTESSEDRLKQMDRSFLTVGILILNTMGISRNV